MAINYALNMFCRPGNCIASIIFFSWLCIPYPTSSRSQCLLLLLRIKGSIRVKTILGKEFKGYFVLVVWDSWDCVMGVCIWDWVSEGIPCFTFVDFYLMWGMRGNLCDCAGYVKVIAYIFY